MKYTGTIVGLRSSYGSIYNVVVDDSKCYLWKANVVAEINGKMLNIVFNWNGDYFEIKSSLLKSDYYTGKLFFNRVEGGEVFLWSFNKNGDLFLKGDFIEDDAGNYDCFIELNPLKADQHSR